MSTPPLRDFIAFTEPRAGFSKEDVDMVNELNEVGSKILDLLEPLSPGSQLFLSELVASAVREYAKRHGPPGCVPAVQELVKAGCRMVEGPFPKA